MFHVTKEICKVFRESSAPYDVEKKNGTSAVVADIPGAYVDGAKIRFISEEEGNDITAVVSGIAKLTDKQREQIYVTLNKLNSSFRYLRFRLDEKGEVIAEYDFPACSENVAEQAFEVYLTTMEMLDDVAKMILSAK